jgi:outer membrane protein insertion porin family
MRHSPSLLALFTLAALLSCASQARGDDSLALQQAVSVAEIMDEAAARPPVLAAQTETSPAIATLEETIRLDEADRPLLSPDPSAVANLASDPVAIEAISPPSAPAATPQWATVQQLSQEPAPPDSTESPDTEAPDASESTPAAPERDQPETVTPPTPADSVEPPALPDAEEAADPAEGEEEPSPSGSETPETTPNPATPPDTATPAETQVLVAEVAVETPQGEAVDTILEDGTPLENKVYDAIGTRPGRTTTRTQIQQDISNIFATGFFSNVRAVPTDTPLGVRVTFVVEPNPVLTRVQIEGGEILPQTVVDEIFSPQYGQIINLLSFQDSILALNNWYQENGYVLAQVIAAPQVQEDGIVTLQVAEGVIEDIQVRFISEDGETEDEEGNPINGKTHDYIITREFTTQPGDVFQQSQIQSDLQRVFGLGIFDDVTVSLNPGKKDPRQVLVSVNVIERNTGSIAAGLGFNFSGDLFGTLSYRQDNFGGNNQKFSAETQLSTRDILFDISFTDPWIGGDPYRTSYTLNGFARRSISLVFDGGPDEINLSNGDRVRVNRYGSGVTFRRPLGNNWDASAGALYQRVRTTDSDGRTFTEDAAGNPLTASGTGADDLFTVQFGVVQDLRNDAFTPTSGSVLRLGTEQSIPLGSGSIFFNRLRASYSYYIPVSFLNFSEGAQAIAVSVQGGTILGDFPPYEAFSLGGTNSVRGYDEGEVGSGQSYLQASIEYRFPLFSFLGGAVFLDAATDLGTGNSVPGSPGPDRGKPGSGFGYGAGVRLQTPLGPIRVDYGFSNEGERQLHFGIGERF